MSNTWILHPIRDACYCVFGEDVAREYIMGEQSEDKAYISVWVHGEKEKYVVKSVISRLDQWHGYDVEEDGKTLRWHSKSVVVTLHAYNMTPLAEEVDGVNVLSVDSYAMECLLEKKHDTLQELRESHEVHDEIVELLAKCHGLNHIL